MRLRRCTTKRTIKDICQARESTEEVVPSLDHMSNNIAVEEWSMSRNKLKRQEGNVTVREALLY